MFKKHNFKIFQCNPNDPNFDLFKFLGEINLYLSELQEKNSVNGVISKITEDFEKIVTMTKLKESKWYVKMSEIINKSLLTGDKFMHEMYLK